MSSINRENEPRISIFDNDYDDNSSNETEGEGSQKDFPPWDMFKSFPSQIESGSLQDNRCFEIIIWILKVLIYGLLFIVVLCSGIAAKTGVLFATSQLQKNQSLRHCNVSGLGRHEVLIEHTEDGRLKWTWCLIFIFLVPECIGVLNTLWHHLFKRKPRMPKIRNIMLMILIDTLHTIGLVLLTFVILPEIEAVQGAAIFCCLCFVPGLLNLLSRNENQILSMSKSRLFKIFDALALVAQISGMFLWPIKHDINKTSTWIFPVALVLCSIRWWSNFVSFHNNIGLVRFLFSVKEDLQPGQHIVQGYVSLWRMFVFINGALVVNVCEGLDAKSFFSPRFTERTYNINLNDSENSLQKKNFLTADGFMPLYVFAIQAICAMIMYQACKFAYRTHMYQFGFAFPTSLASLGTVCLIMALCDVRNKDLCAFHNVPLRDYSVVFFLRESLFGNWSGFISTWYVWCWLIWLMSQIWITRHLWTTENERLALAERIFSTITYDSLMIDQCLALNRKTQNEYDDKNDEEKNKNAEILNDDDFKIEATDISLDIGRIEQDFDREDLNTTINKRKDRVTRIYACATMWHEEKNEMNHLVNSILRLNKDQSAMHVTQEHYKVHIEDYYELETHIFFDDAFCCMHGCIDLCNHDENETQVNQYVITLVETIQRNVENLRMHYTPPIKYPTPYGGRLVWTLPQLVVHLKDKNKIRHRKRWSQVIKRRNKYIDT